VTTPPPPANRRGPWVLMSEGGNGASRAAVAAVRALAAAGYRTTVTETDGRSLAGASRWCDRRVSVPALDGDGRAFAEAVRAEQATRPYVTTFVLTDAALLALGVTAPVRDLLDKEASADMARAAGLETPPTEAFPSRADLLRAAERLDYPVIVKPALKLSSARLVRHAASLPAEIGSMDGRILVQPMIDAPFHGLGGVAFQGRLVAAMRTRYLRLWPQPCGTVAAAETLPADPALEARVAHLLHDYDGPFHLDFVGPYVLDVNTRVHATLPLAVAGGANLVAMYCDLLRGRAVPTVRVPPGLRFRWLEGDLRSIWWGARHGTARRRAVLTALSPRRGTIHSFASLSDPGPAAARAGYMARRLREGMSRSISKAARLTTSSNGSATSR
jgi:hypothetical protein